MTGKGKIIIEPSGRGTVTMVILNANGDNVGDAELTKEQWETTKRLVDERMDAGIE